MSELLEAYQRTLEGLDTSAIKNASPVLVGHNDSRETRFFALGTLTNRDNSVFAGLKVDDDSIERRFHTELATMAFIGAQAPKVIGKMASFYALLKTDEGEPIGILTEDFTHGGLLKGHPFPTSPRTQEAILIACKDSVMPPDVKRMACYFGDIGNNIEKLVDFKPLLTLAGWKDPLFHQIREELRELNRDGKMSVIIPTDCDLVTSL